jgi:hypothetical protein
LNFPGLLTKFEEVSGQDILVQIVVRQVENLEDRESAETTEIEIDGSMSRAAAITQSANKVK